MKLSSGLFAATSIALVATANPLDARDDVQTVHLTFHGGPASYDMTIPANGKKFKTSEERQKSCAPFPTPLLPPSRIDLLASRAQC